MALEKEWDSQNVGRLIDDYETIVMLAESELQLCDLLYKNETRT